MRTFLLVILGLILLVVVAGAGYVSYRLYSILPENTAPSQAEYPQAALDLLKVSIVEDDIVIPGWLQLCYSAARKLFYRLPYEKYRQVSRLGEWHQNWIFVALWVGSNWSQHEILTTLLHEQRYDHKWKGLELASQQFFGVSVYELSIPEIAVLIANIQSNSAYDPWCYRDKVQQKASKILIAYQKVVPNLVFDSNQMFSRLRLREDKFCETEARE
ncbi:MAG: transglycosylase domain-containing protein [Alphaproteobacteria bacterium]|nr:transglycosylase domain-containing protein [Alphaproteobacteria bacterium]QQS57049.1 MAG: transglycosylase domain-containing protein [Alphaproteobacteria bacterium]